MRTKINRLGFKGFLIVLLAVMLVTPSSVRAQCPPSFVENFDGVTPPALPAEWTASQGVNVTGAPLWVTASVMPHTAPNDAFSTAPDNILDNRLDTPVLMASIFDPGIVFQNNYNLESGRDGAVLEISSPNINGGAFTDITDSAVGGSVTPGYNSVISSAFQSPIAGRMAWSGNSGGYVATQAFFGKAAFPLAHSVKVRFRLVSDNSGASEGWRIDTVSVPHTECGSPTPTATATVPPTATPTPTDCPGVCGSPTPSPTVTPTLTPTPTPTPTVTPSLSPAQALNISTRSRVETGDRVMIGGFIITGSEPKKVAIRGVGPSLASAGLTDVLADPILELRGSDSALLVQNDDWQDDPAQAAELANLGLALPDPSESGIVATLDPGTYTAILAGKDQTSGIALVEIYDADAAAASRLANISTRGFVQAGDNVMIGGFILGHGGGSTTVAVRGIGPSLEQLGLSSVLADPTLELRDGNGALLVANDNWQDDPDTAALLTAQGLAPQDPLESGIFATLPPGLFTAILAGQDGGAGLGLLEVFSNLQPPTITVTSRLQNGPGTLRQALLDVQNGGRIQFDPALYGSTISQNGGHVIDKNIVLSGPGSNQLSIQLNGILLSVFRITAGHTVTVEGLTIRGGHARTSGGGIRNEGSTLTINRCVIGPNSSDGTGAGIYNDPDSRLTIISSAISGNFCTGGFLNPFGGGIDNIGTVEIRNSSVSGNGVGNGTILPGAGGGIGNLGPMTIINSTISGNGGASGGGIYNNAPLAIVNSTISGNRANPNDQGLGSVGGGISNTDVLTITNSTISGNSADYGAGIFNNGPLTITHTTISNNQVDPVSGSIQNSGSLEIGNSILKAGTEGESIVGGGTVISRGYNLSSDTGGGFLSAPGDRINTNPALGPLQNNGGPTFTHGLLPGSLAIDAGDPAFISPSFTDQRGPGYNRVDNGRIDIGSFEVQP
jgi:hypothetical protein